MTRTAVLLCNNINVKIVRVFSREIHSVDYDHVTRRSTFRYLANIMGVYPSTAKRKLRHNVELTTKPLLNIVETYETLEKLNFDKSLIADNITVLALSSAQVKQRHKGLRELGIERFDVPEVLRFAEITSQSRESLISAGIASIGFDLHNSDVWKQADGLREIASLLNDSISLHVVRNEIMAETIVRKLKTERKIAELMIDACSPLQLSSLSYIAETLAILTDEFNLREQIRFNPIVLSVPPDDIESIVSIASEFSLDVHFMALERPRVLCTSPNSFKFICHCMNEYGVSTETLKRFPAIFDHSPDFIRSGLKLLSVWPDFDAIRSNSNLFRLLVVARQANQRLSYLKRDQPGKCSLKHLITRDESFKQLLVSTAREESVGGQELMAYLADMLNCSYERVARNFDLDADFPTMTSMAVVRNTLRYLQGKGFTKDALCNGLGLMLYPWPIVDKVLKELPNSELVQPYAEWKQNENVLHLVLYLIKRDLGRDGVWDHPQIEVREDMESTGVITEQ